ncbi:MAG: hypothetical protein HDS82_03855 [Bacteroidales bacterium]|nr:hypothetical protein [Bacteroidales bacterium]
MRIISKSIFILGAVAISLTGCSSDDLQGGAELRLEGKTLPVSLTAKRPSDVTRTSLTTSEDGTSLASVWTEGDRLTVVSESGLLMGVLTLESGEGSDTGVFSGILDGVDNGTKCHVIYLGADNGDSRKAYTTANIAENGSVTLHTGFATDEDRNVSGAFADLKRADLMKQTVTLDIREEGKAYAAADGVMNPCLAMAHFSLSGIPENLSENATLTVSSYGEGTNLLPYALNGSETLCGETYGYKVSDVDLSNSNADIYLPFIPGEYLLTFDLNDGDKHYTYTFAAPTNLEAGKYYATMADGIPGEGISVMLEEQVQTPEPVADADVVGPVFEVNGKKFRFTRANLKYNTVSEEWSLMENQYSFICQAGWTLSNGSDGTGKKTPEEIDMFGFGTTGLYEAESGETAQAPTFWRQIATQSYGNAAYYYPTNNTTVNSGQGYTGSFLDREHGVQFMSFDWGKAYYLYKRGEAYPTKENPNTSYDSSNERYFTLSSKDWSELSKDYYVYGATIQNAIDGKTDVTGLIILNVTGTSSEKLTKVKELLAGNVTYLGSPSSLNALSITSNTSFKCDQIKMSVAQFEKLEEAGLIVFLPQAGHKAMDSMTKTDGCYWTSTAGQSYNSTYLRFDGRTSASPKIYQIIGVNRSLGCAVRLVKEVAE